MGFASKESSANGELMAGVYMKPKLMIVIAMCILAARLVHALGSIVLVFPPSCIF